MGSQVKLSWREFNTGAGKTMVNLLSDRTFSDVTIICDTDKQIAQAEQLKHTKPFLARLVSFLRIY